MTLYGDLFVPPLCPRIICFPMSTAIVRTYTSEGFVIAADGRAIGVEERRVVTDTAQKVFPIEWTGGSLAYSVAGTLQISSDDRRQVFNLILETEKAQAAVTNTPASLVEYASLLAERITVRLAAVKGHYPSTDNRGINQRGFRIATLFLEGYYGSAPYRARVDFCHERQNLLEPEVIPQDSNLGRPQICGSGEVSYLLFDTDDPRFAAYRRPVLRAQDVTLAEAIEVSKGYINACMDPEALQIDETICSTIGGHIHIATITPSHGFRWVQGFEPLSL
jgi:hypothetical protein